MVLRGMKLLLILGLTGLACSKDDNDSNKAEFELKDLVGLWSVDCQPSEFGQMSLYRVAMLQITEAGNFIYENTHYADSQCTEKRYDESSKGSVQINEAVDANGRLITITGTEGTGTARHDTVVKAANILSICGFEDWVKDQPKNLLKTDCIDWSESNSTDGINLIEISDGKRQIQLFRILSDGTKAMLAGDSFTEELPKE